MNMLRGQQAGKLGVAGNDCGKNLRVIGPVFAHAAHVAGGKDQHRAVVGRLAYPYQPSRMGKWDTIKRLGISLLPDETISGVSFKLKRSLNTVYT